VRERAVPTLGLLALVAAAPLALLHFLGREEVQLGGGLHFAGVAFSAAVATAAALALTIVGAGRRDGRATLVGVAFSVMAALLCLHGIATPGVLMGDNGVVAFTGGATLPVGGAILALTALPALRRPEAVAPLLGLLALSLAVVAGLGTAAVAEPDLVPGVPEPSSPLALTVLVVGLGFYGLLAVRALRTFLLTRRAADALVAVGIVWLGASLAASLTLGWWQLGWWLGHAFEIVGIVLIGIPVAADLHRSAQSRPLVGDLRGAELVEAEEAFLGSQVRALMVALAAKDAYTECHTRRVALRAVEVGEALGLAGPRLRTLAIGGLLHDIGKLQVPDGVLRKPGTLTEAEYAVVKKHAEWGTRLLSELGGFAAGVHRLVRDHHERLDGSGYPHGLRATELDLDTRILAVCDVYDALISDRVYRPAWSHERAMSLLYEGAGTLFDARCIEALGRVLARQHGEALAVAI
jgi:HD-GYP domain-containing protein (c-di-GMP phosphodiesterase class II)